MAKKRTKGKATKKVARKKVARKGSTKTASAKRRTGKVAKKPRKAAPKASPSPPAGPKTIDSAGAMNLLRAWSRSRYSTR